MLLCGNSVTRLVSERRQRVARSASCRLSATESTASCSRRTVNWNSQLQQAKQRVEELQAAAANQSATAEQKAALLVRVKTEKLDAKEEAILTAQRLKRAQADAVAAIAAADAAAAVAACRICMDAPRSILFQPCSHLLCCQSCAEQVSRCPTCQEAIRSRLHVFVS